MNYNKSLTKSPCLHCLQILAQPKSVTVTALFSSSKFIAFVKNSYWFVVKCLKPFKLLKSTEEKLQGKRLPLADLQSVKNLSR